MENCVFIGTKIEKETMDNVAEFIERVFKAGKENFMDQDTVVQALEIFKCVVKTENVSLNNCCFVGEKTVNVESEGSN